MQTDNNPALTLNESFLTGIDEIDRQHQILVNLINDAYQALLDNQAAVNIRSIVRELLAYAIYHFNTEESLLHEYACTVKEKHEAEEHIAMHRQFSERIISIQEKLQKQEYVDPGELLDFLREWINDHVLNTDKVLAELVLSKRK